MEKHRSGIVIIGAGQAGARAALSLRAEGWQGRIVLIGDEQHLPYERPPLSKEVLLDEQYDIAPMATTVDYQNSAIGLLLNARVLSIDTHERRVQLRRDGRDETLCYEKLLIATGGRARQFGGDQAPDARVLSLRTKNDAIGLSASLRSGTTLLIIGGGFTGLEIAASARQRGCEVIVLEGESRLLSRNVPIQLAARIQALHCARGVTIHLSEQPVAIDRRASRLAISCASGKEFAADLVVACIGMIPNVELASDAGLRVNRGVLVDRHLQTSAEDVYAIGDVSEFPMEHSESTLMLESWNNAESQARLVARNMLGASLPYRPTPWFWSEHYDHTLQMAGWPGTENLTVVTRVTRVTRELPGACIDFYMDAKMTVIGATGFAPTATLAKSFLLARKLVESARICRPDELSDTTIPLKNLLKPVHDLTARP